MINFQRPLVALFLLTGSLLLAQTEPVEGLRDNTPAIHALTNARIIISPESEIKSGTVILRDGFITAVGSNIRLPADARVWDYSGKTIYPGLIEPYLTVDLEPAESGSSERMKAESTPGTGYWNKNIRPERRVATSYSADDKSMKELRSLGFTAALVAPGSEVIRGVSSMMSTGDTPLEQRIIAADVALHIAVKSAGWRSGTYPSSLMGAIALTRQTFIDAQWYRQAHAAVDIGAGGQSVETNDALAALGPALSGRMPVVFEVADDLDLLRSAKIAAEFNLKAIYRGSGYEYRQAGAIKALGQSLILPVDFPQELQVEMPEDALQVDLEDMQHWELAPSSPAILHRSGIPFAITTAGLKKSEDIFDRLRSAIERGLPASRALAALTTIPAEMYNVGDHIGTVAVNKRANLLVSDGDLFSADRKIIDVWVDGKRFMISHPSGLDPSGDWSMEISAGPGAAHKFDLQISGKPGELKATISAVKSIEVKKIELEDRQLLVVFRGDSLGHPGIVRMTGSVGATSIAGSGELPDGQIFDWHAARVASEDADQTIDDGDEKDEKTVGKSADLSDERLRVPGAYGYQSQPDMPAAVLVRNATIWTLDGSGRVENADLLVKNGKIAAVGSNLRAPDNAVIIDGTGKHVTPGLIDAHSHSALTGGVNEGRQAVTAEVSIGDVIDSYDIAIYRELAGGLTAANLLHGSANPIGGQSEVIKLRWGALPEAMKVTSARPGIKFALGENVKRSNSSGPDVRYPSSRMGVEQLIRDRFLAALDYEKEWQLFNKVDRKLALRTIPPRTDLELDILLEIIHGKRWIHCHSYRQDEILMLARLAEEFGLQVAAFQHVLEGYKVADVLAKNNFGASTFSDWWGYKFEVYDAIPYNGALMAQQGVLVSFNSDSDELARRLNTEAAKAVRYGGMSEVEALKFVTLNPAKQLGLDDRMGSLEEGKDADFVIWSRNPLSVYTVCEQTWIDGRKYFDREKDAELRQEVQNERSRLVQKYLSEGDGARKKGSGGKSGKRGRRPESE